MGKFKVGEIVLVGERINKIKRIHRFLSENYYFFEKNEHISFTREKYITKLTKKKMEEYV